MIFSKGNAAVEKLADSKKGAVWFTGDGASFVIGKECWAMVGPVLPDIKKAIPLDNTETSPFSISPGAAQAIVKTLGRDTTFGGLLENFDGTISDKTDDVEIITTDGKRTHSIGLKALARGKDAPAKNVVDAMEAKGAHAVLSRKTLKSLLDVMDKACPDPGGVGATWITLCDDGSMVLEGINTKTGQRFLGEIKTSRLAEPLERSQWQTEYLGRFYEKREKGPLKPQRAPMGEKVRKKAPIARIKPVNKPESTNKPKLKGCFRIKRKVS